MWDASLEPWNWGCVTGEAVRVYPLCVRVDVGVYACGVWYARRLGGSLLWWDDRSIGGLGRVYFRQTDTSSWRGACLPFYPPTPLMNV
jgi:hypothetical protein